MVAADRLGSENGPIVDEEGAVVGQHQGAYTYTIGQRRGLNLSVPTEGGTPRYVLKIEPKTNTVVVGAKEALAISHINGEKAIAGVDHNQRAARAHPWICPSSGPRTTASM
jgi:tRNA-specific 2-thiouridylase